jgi:hypothetical protein
MSAPPPDQTDSGSDENGQRALTLADLPRSTYVVEELQRIKHQADDVVRNVIDGKIMELRQKVNDEQDERHKFKMQILVADLHCRMKRALLGDGSILDFACSPDRILDNADLDSELGRLETLVNGVRNITYESLVFPESRD